jgi:glutamate synthase domain-containing protein 2
MKNSKISLDTSSASRLLAFTGIYGLTSMKNQSHNEELESRIHSLVDERLFRVFWDGVAHFKTNDLVLFFDETEEVDPVTIFSREKMLSEDNVPASLRTKLNKPARGADLDLTSSDTAFWLVAIFAQGGMACVAISAKPIAPGGQANAHMGSMRHSSATSKALRATAD